MFDQRGESRVYSVSELTGIVKDLLENTLGFVTLRGEITNFKPAASGHVYFTLKDSQATISAALFRNSLNRLRGLRLENGLEVICHGRISVYPPRGTYQLIVENLELVGAGSLQAKFDALKKKLHLEGLFTLERKRPLPQMPRKIAVITSPTGAAVRDVISVLKRRHAGVAVIIIPSLVQGIEAEAELVQAMRLANDIRLGADVILLTRGGGSMEDLWSFNSEILAREIFNSRLPVVSAVGHEVDFTIADFVADIRAPTPSAAAEILVRESTHLQTQVAELRERIRRAMARGLEARSLRLHGIQAKLRSPVARIQELKQRFDDWIERLAQAIQQKVTGYDIAFFRTALFQQARLLLRRERLNHEHAHQALRITAEKIVQSRREQLARLEAAMQALSPLAVLERGYSLTYRSDGKIVKNSTQVKIGEGLEIRLAQGRLSARVEGN